MDNTILECDSIYQLLKKFKISGQNVDQNGSPNINNSTSNVMNGFWNELNGSNRSNRSNPFNGFDYGKDSSTGQSSRIGGTIDLGFGLTRNSSYFKPMTGDNPRDNFMPSNGNGRQNKQIFDLSQSLNGSIDGNFNITNNGVYGRGSGTLSVNKIWKPIEDCFTNSQLTFKRIMEEKLISQMKATANYNWTGQLPRKTRNKNPIYSCKVFLGGIPYDLTDSDLHCTFAQYGNIQIQWPGKDIRSAIDSATHNKAGYVYIIFESYDNVTALLQKCTVSYKDVESGYRFYYNLSSRRQKAKEVQVIPFDIGDRFYMKNTFSGQMEHSKTVFVGALHGMLSAEGLARVMDDLFGGVVFAGLDTDKHKYPLGSGRVSFDNKDSYDKAVAAAFIEIKSPRFKKKIQIDPYIENECECAICHTQQQMPIYCRDEFKYFCLKCWEEQHSDPESKNHRVIVKNKQQTA
ncbi:cytoplasmic polyadenylation element-binding protein 1-B-like isoform X2 [Oppia nitens]|uniref:cytoplasmic polyadenylation element-binding protein 1-B-like isoform X2 n=1 Tax=Oppia nitens TaxID=1686743 RepID=UPI0023DBD036|nr:cytoplasmic polyadenylation element-binding protein 1-B-like isoform X2 [Oppia nitens]